MRRFLKKFSDAEKAVPRRHEEPERMKRVLTRVVDENIENFKRRRTVSPFMSLDDETRAFFEKMVSVRKLKDFAFLRREDPRDH